MSNSNKPSTWFWIIGIVALLWNLMGVFSYINQAYKTESFKAMYTPEQLEVINNMPAWATAAFAIAVFGGALGSILLLLKKRIAGMVFLISLIGILVQFTYNIFVANAIELYGATALAMPIVVILFGVFLVWYAKKQSKKGVLS